MYDARHFNSWLRIAANLSHYWSAFSDEILAEFRTAFIAEGWAAVRALCDARKDDSPWSQSFARFGGILPPKGMDHIHVTTTGRLAVSVSRSGDVHLSVYRPIGQAKIEVAKFIFDGVRIVWAYTITDDDWKNIGGEGRSIEERHFAAVNEALFGSYVQDYITDSTMDSTTDDQTDGDA